MPGSPAPRVFWLPACLLGLLVGALGGLIFTWTAWSGFRFGEHPLTPWRRPHWVGLGAGAGFGLAAAYALIATEVRTTRLRFALAPFAGFALLFLSLLITFTLSFRDLPSTFGFEVIARTAVLLGPSCVLALTVADLIQRPTGFLRDAFVRALFAAIGSLPLWIFASDEPKAHLLPGLGAGALFGLAMTAPRTLSSIPRRSLHVGFAVMLLLSVVSLAAWERVDRRDANPYGKIPRGRALFRLLQYLEDHASEVEADPGDLSGAAALKALAGRWSGIESTAPLPGDTLEEATREYARRLSTLDPDWGTAVGFLTGAEGLTHHRDEDLRARAALDVSLHAALKRFPDGEILEARLVFMLWTHALRDLRKEDSTLALDGVYAIFAVLARNDLSTDRRIRAATSRLADLPRVVEETPPGADVQERDLSYCDAVTAYLESLKSLLADAPELRAALQALTRHRTAINARPRLEGRRRLGLGPRLFRAMLNAEGETRSFADLAGFAKEEIIDNFTGVLNSIFQRNESLGRTALAVEGYEEEDTDGRFATEMALARKLLGTTFPIAPAGEVTIAAAPPFQTAGDVAAIYHPVGPLEGPSDAIVLRVKQDQKPDRLALRTLAWHETWPGHHLQQLLARTHAPFARRVLPSTFYIEGWASYAEGFADASAKGDEQFLMSSLRSFGRSGEAVQVLEDLVVHVLQPTEDEAAELMKRAHGWSLEGGRAHAQTIHDRGGQFSAYALGRDAFTKARAARQAALGSAYTDLDFHTAVLQLGPIPPSRITELLALPKPPPGSKD